jgi:hypothetical protein
MELDGFRHAIQSGILTLTSKTGNSYKDSLSTEYTSFSFMASTDKGRTGTPYSLHSFSAILSVSGRVG